MHATIAPHGYLQACSNRRLITGVSERALVLDSEATQNRRAVSCQPRLQWRLRDNFRLRLLPNINVKTPHQSANILVRVFHWTIESDGFFISGMLHRQPKRTKRMFTVDAKDDFLPCSMNSTQLVLSGPVLGRPRPASPFFCFLRVCLSSS